MPVSKNSLRALPQYKNLTEEEFDELWRQRQVDAQPLAEYEKRIALKLAEFENEYDLTDLKYNDRETLRAMFQAMITLEDYENFSYKLRLEEGVDESSVGLHDKLHKFMSDLRSDISRMQDDLKISRKTRKGDKQEAIVTQWELIQRKAKEFYQARMSYIYCPECKMLLSTAWFLYPNNNNKLAFECGRESCGHKFTITSKELLDNHNRNIQDVPEF